MGYNITITSNWLSKDEINNLQKTFDNVKFEPSTYYNVKSKENVVDNKIRSSSKHNIKESSVYDLLNNKFKQINYLFVPIDLQLVKYTKGDFFAKHKDYSNGTNDSTFIICLKSATQGGETLIFAKKPDSLLSAEINIHDSDKKQKNNKKQKVNKKQTKFGKNRKYFGIKQQCGSLLLFDKKYYHSGQLISEGTKLIIKGNAVKIEKEPFIVIMIQ